jgi:hypothetical protein
MVDRRESGRALRTVAGFAALYALLLYGFVLLATPQVAPALENPVLCSSSGARQDAPGGNRAAHHVAGCILACGNAGFVSPFPVPAGAVAAHPIGTGSLLPQQGRARQVPDGPFRSSTSARGPPQVA